MEEKKEKKAFLTITRFYCDGADNKNMVIREALDTAWRMVENYVQFGRVRVIMDCTDWDAEGYFSIYGGKPLFWRTAYPHRIYQIEVTVI